MEKNIRKSSREIEREKFRLVINERKKRGLGELKLTPHLIHAAREHSKDMIRRHFFSLNKIKNYIKKVGENKCKREP